MTVGVTMTGAAVTVGVMVIGLAVTVGVTVTAGAVMVGAGEAPGFCDREPSEPAAWYPLTSFASRNAGARLPIGSAPPCTSRSSALTWPCAYAGAAIVHSKPAAMAAAISLIT